MCEENFIQNHLVFFFATYGLVHFVTDFVNLFKFKKQVQEVEKQVQEVEKQVQEVEKEPEVNLEEISESETESESDSDYQTESESDSDILIINDSSDDESFCLRKKRKII